MEKDLKYRGQRNNNPLNIVVSKSKWVGKVTDPQEKKDSKFEEFTDMKYGIRAAIVLLMNYIKQGTDTVPAIIRRWCPDETADTYINIVMKQLKKWFPDFPRRKAIGCHDFEVLMRLVQAMAVVESQYHIADNEFLEAWLTVNTANRYNHNRNKAKQQEQ